ncbi:MAG: phosphate ABC transporter permease PstA [Oricola sp.]
MTDTVIAQSSRTTNSLHTGDAARRRLAKRYRTESWFKWLGAGAVIVSGIFLVLLLSTIVTEGIPAFRQNYLLLNLDLAKEKVEAGNFDAIVQDALYTEFPGVEGRQDRRLLRGLLSTGSGTLLRQKIEADPSIAGAEYAFQVPLDDFADLYLKGLEARKDAPIFPNGRATPSATSGSVSVIVEANAFGSILQAIKTDLARQADALAENADRLTSASERDEQRLSSLRQTLAATADAGDKARLAAQIDEFRNRVASFRADSTRLTGEASALRERASRSGGSEALTDDFASYFLYINGGTIILDEIQNDVAKGETAVPLDSMDPAASGSWNLVRIAKPQVLRKISDREIAWIDHLKANGRIESTLNSIFLMTGASREPELAGIWGAVIGSALTMIVTMLLSFPIGVASAIYLEEFAPKNRITQFIEVNINNLAAVPSIVFGLLGLAVFINWLGMPRSAPLVGGLVLALMTLPTIIIAGRAALRAVPPSIREAALGVGASKIQTVFHHVLPLAMPGISTGTIIGMAQALGETAPLLMIGMVAFIVDIPGGFTDPATVLPVQIYMWADFPEPAFQQKTSAAILILLAFLIVMNAVAVFLRRRFERRW